MAENIDTRDMNKPLSVNHLPMRIFGGFAILFFTFLAVVSINLIEFYYILFYFLLICISVLLFVLYGHTEMDNESIVLNTLIGQFKITWVEVQRIETDSYSTFIFIGENKQLMIPHKFLWFGKEKKTMRALMDDQIDKREIPIIVSPWASYKLPKNTKISSWDIE